MSAQSIDCAIGQGSCAAATDTPGATPTNNSSAAKATMVEISRRFELLGIFKDARLARLRQVGDLRTILPDSLATSLAHNRPSPLEGDRQDGGELFTVHDGDHPRQRDVEPGESGQALDGAGFVVAERKRKANLDREQHCQGNRTLQAEFQPQQQCDAEERLRRRQ